MLDPKQQELMSLVEQVESLPAEVLDVVMYRRKEAEKGNKQAEKATKDEMSQMYDLMQKFKLKQPIQAPSPVSNPLQSMLSGALGDVDPGLMV